jgi:hypothetical protein
MLYVIIIFCYQEAVGIIRYYPSEKLMRNRLCQDVTIQVQKPTVFALPKGTYTKIVAFPLKIEDSLFACFPYTPPNKLSQQEKR